MKTKMRTDIKELIEDASDYLNCGMDLRVTLAILKNTIETTEDEWNYIELVLFHLSILLKQNVCENNQ